MRPSISHPVWCVQDEQQSCRTRGHESRTVTVGPDASDPDARRARGVVRLHLVQSPEPEGGVPQLIVGVGLRPDGITTTNARLSPELGWQLTMAIQGLLRQTVPLRTPGSDPGA